MVEDKGNRVEVMSHLTKYYVVEKEAIYETMLVKLCIFVGASVLLAPLYTALL